MLDMSIKSSITVRLSIETLKQKIGPVVSEIFEFQNRDISIMITLFEIFGLSGL